ncbi:MAG: putative OsmC-like protein, partial [Cyclobacteriaceae bacterium]
MHIKSTYQGELRTEATHIASGLKIITDAPVDNHGKGEAFSPTDLVAGALASCLMTIMGIEANKMSISLDGLSTDT